LSNRNRKIEKVTVEIRMSYKCHAIPVKLQMNRIRYTSLYLVEFEDRNWHFVDKSVAVKIIAYTCALAPLNIKYGSKLVILNNLYYQMSCS